LRLLLNIRDPANVNYDAIIAEVCSWNDKYTQSVSPNKTVMNEGNYETELLCLEVVYAL